MNTTNTEQHPKIKGWVARDEDGTLCCFSKKPERMSNTIAGHFWFNEDAFELRKDVFPKLTWEDEPIEVELTINNMDSSK